MGNVVQTRASLRDIDAIWDHIAEDSPLRASRYIRKIQEKLELLADIPLMGRSRPELAANVRSFPVGSHLIFYMPVPDGIVVLRVRHQREDIEGLIL